ncbi:metal transporter Nramp4 isoform X2 [Abrus precatorius]|uniref:Metal transporter Nramp4 isoform X2 n=1 Tax=Abrus precatorius TaxID=3816 RepID=A0A8B8LYM8_ABRPR|nr:metal transporter Nramp4 isoform X2 [Abrus precatorius]
MPPQEHQQPLLSDSGEDQEETAYDSSEKVVVVGVDEHEADVDEWAQAPPFSWKKLWLFTGPGFLMSIAFLDPGNLEGDLQSGAIAGYSLLWLLMWATAMGLVIQLLSARLGVATGRHLAELCREEYPTWARIVLWLMTEVALIGSDIQEVIGSAIAIRILSNNVVPLWAGVVITALDWQIDPSKKGRVQEALNYYSIESTIALVVSFVINIFVTTVFAKGFYGTEIANSIGLVNAGQYLQEKYGGGLFPILYIWGIGLLAAGQSSTITGTYAGQFIMGGFLNLKLKKWIRALITRSFAIIPTMIVALIFDTSEESLDVLNEWLNVLQSVQIPFALIPLLCLVSKEQIMGSFKIGPVLKIISWLVAALVIVINGYLLLEFFSAEVTGAVFTTIVCAITAAYVAFVLYLIARAITFSPWQSLTRSKTVACTED